MVYEPSLSLSRRPKEAEGGRVISANGDWHAFQAFRIEQETSRLYPHRDATEKIPLPIPA